MPFPPTHPTLMRALADKGYAEPTPVQAAVLEPETLERDLLVSAQTGSGKTVAYGLAMSSTLLGEAEQFGPGGAPLALIVAPTRELALQVQRELIWLYGPTRARVISCVGGMDVRKEQFLLKQGAHIVVGTPGRLCDHLDRGVLVLSNLKVLVLDEADEMLDLGFREELEKILAAAPAERRTLLFSATIPKEIVALTKKFQRDALRIALSARDEPHGDIEYKIYPIAQNDIEHAVVNVLRYFDVRGAMVFCGTRESVRHLHASLEERGFHAVSLSGELTQAERNRALQALRDGRARVCVATDVAARGLDLPDLGLVIHAELPQNKEVMQHRSGRTGRAGKKGVTVLLVPTRFRRRAEMLLRGAKIDVAWAMPPTAEQIREKDQQRLVREIVAQTEDLGEEDLNAARALLAERSPEELVAVLVAQQRGLLPAPEELDVAAIKQALAPEPMRREFTPRKFAGPKKFGKPYGGGGNKPFRPREDGGGAPPFPGKGPKKFAGKPFGKPKKG